MGPEQSIFYLILAKYDGIYLIMKHVLLYFLMCEGNTRLFDFYSVGKKSMVDKLKCGWFSECSSVRDQCLTTCQMVDSFDFTKQKIETPIQIRIGNTENTVPNY